MNVSARQHQQDWSHRDVTTLQPTQLALQDKDTLIIQWSDGQRRGYNVTDLRLACPCATCNMQRNRAGLQHGQPLSPAAPVTIQQMTPVGNYAYSIHFSDGHRTGIYILELLRSLGAESSKQDPSAT
jgi:ATP-binding protein involved in chromosome partitioning